MNHVILVGKLMNPWHFNKTQKGVSVASNIVITNEDRAEGKADEEHELVVWGQRAEQIVDLSRQGDTITIVGKIITSIWQSKTGKERKTKKIHVHKLEVS